LPYNETVQILVARSDSRPFELARFDAAWARAGGDPSELVFVTPSTADEVITPYAVFGGLLLTGGPDVEPARYGGKPEQGVELHSDRERDALDLGLLGRAEREGWPVLAVCYGCQVMNVFYGGTLIQDLDRAGKPGHYVGEPKDHLTHVVRKCGGGGGRWLDGCPEEFPVNSRHHQGLADVAAPLDVILAAPDGVVEAVKLRHGSRFVLGVQWHPENLIQAEHVTLFAAFRSACLAPFAVHGPRSTIFGAR
jgi:putative glutamine amidotransferase